MRLKIFSAKTMQEALSQIREKLGDNAVILDTEEEDGLVKITAAVEAPAARVNPRKTAPPAPAPSPVKKSLRELDDEQKIEEQDLEFFLSHHGLPDSLKLRLLDLANAMERESKLLSLASALDSQFKFEPLTGPQEKPILLVGPPGVGKTVTAAKLASQALLNRIPVRLVSTDTLRMGGLAQLEGYADRLHIPVTEVSSPDQLATALKPLTDEKELILIDTGGFNPFSAEELDQLHQYITAGDVEPVLVISAGADPVEAREIAETYAALGVRRFIATRLDVSRRYASLMVTADSGGLTFAGVGITPYLADGIQPLDALHLARLLTKIPKRQELDHLKQAPTEEEQHSDIEELLKPLSEPTEEDNPENPEESVQK
ncbi:AAA family ATPase [Emcibacter nanhaiensis]|uniref:AAA family ATPase n=1 Tax=Emcibacter nanhaiensis TaxID=1505037 RepID=A0A501PP32_9PROT|nr:AAA family ATPase [Emcibacter nanhaiensis]TPD62015.1 AAA family ATPase [Emcibacter nanhaiensis]